MKTTDQLYEELRAVIDNGNESMTHEDALAHVVELQALAAPGGDPTKTLVVPLVAKVGTTEPRVNLDDEIVIKTTLRKLLRMQKERPDDVTIQPFDYMERVGIQWRVAVQMHARDFQLSQAALNLTE